MTTKKTRNESQPVTAPVPGTPGTPPQPATIKKGKQERLVCPECSIPLEEEYLKTSLICPGCKTDLKNAKYLDLIEYLVANGLVTDIDFFDMKIYKGEIERLDPVEQEEVDPQAYEKKKEMISLFEGEIERLQKQNAEQEEQVNQDDLTGLEEDWEEFNRRTEQDRS